MTPTQVQLVQNSLKRVVPLADIVADLFYARLFVLAPEVRGLFPGDLSAQKKKLMQMLATTVGNLQRMEKILPPVQALGRRHIGYGVTDDHYEVVGEALLWALAQGIGVDFTPPVKEAWMRTYLTVAGVMKQAAADAASAAA